MKHQGNAEEDVEQNLDTVCMLLQLTIKATTAIMINTTTTNDATTATATTTNNSKQHQAILGQHSHAHSFSIPIYLKLPFLHRPRNFPLSLEFFLRHLPTPFGNDLVFFFGLSKLADMVTFGILFSFILRTCLSPLNLFLIRALESRIRPHLSYSLLFEIRLVSRTSYKPLGNFSGKHLENLLSFFEMARLQHRA